MLKQFESEGIDITDIYLQHYNQLILVHPKRDLPSAQTDQNELSTNFVVPRGFTGVCGTASHKRHIAARDVKRGHGVVIARPDWVVRWGNHEDVYVASKQRMVYLRDRANQAREERQQKDN